MKELGLQELLRYALSGGVGIASLLLMYPKLACSMGHIAGAGEVTLILGSILVVGTLVYNIHRALLNPVIFRVIGLITLPWKFTWKLFIPWWPSDAEMDFDNWRWGLKNRRRWEVWAAHTHFLYCAAWATLAAFLFGRYVPGAGSPSCQAWHIFDFLFWVSLVAGIVNNFRLLYSINAEREHEHSRSEMSRL